MSDRPFRYSSRNWFGKASAGLILGFVIAIALSGVWAWAGPGGLMASSIKTQLNMWMVPPIWALILSLCFFFRSGVRAWAWLGLAAVICAGALYVAKFLVGGLT
ncbi:MAG: hypothetical protein CME84_06410 [Henriciella sp.]|uniref:hypothetical protein n=1 Tax=Henriciella sp. TaxID=1968823 RepID=UPI000C0E09D4|nr:hypothetical protein [Henriciella sp.]MAN73709.1 hypothetical protein [Henriciella sp.]MBF35084.1 hypothetical protein [Hyphomonadaceae bacterium]PHR74911.1 MAG: hypothetical protein COA64_13350 [Henriciella sp.]|tara:strand:- start:1482 stop:1793 length:312 start_codon:yes stop_codon:yes gene_type:complete